jgi:hypothetical protein
MLPQVGELGPGESQVLFIPLNDLRLPPEPMSFSGHMIVGARIDYVDGNFDRAGSPLELDFHPASGGWQLYDSEARRSRYDDGALTDAARAIKRSVIEASGGRAEFTPFAYQGAPMPIDYMPSPDGQPDPEG